MQGEENKRIDKKKRTQVVGETQKTMQVSSLGNGVYAASPIKRKIVSLLDLTPINHTNYRTRLNYNLILFIMILSLYFAMVLAKL